MQGGGAQRGSLIAPTGTLADELADERGTVVRLCQPLTIRHYTAPGRRWIPAPGPGSKAMPG
jgi:hypothetical protein